ncbi:MAG TPA: YHS domain-containing (seleno)protein [Xanthobacteraceae bacterium]|jgi:hypothetical protein|nr:YHS domain-containing (seleno)protein [Xanthobacteraceae bacterium]
MTTGRRKRKEFRTRFVSCLVGGAGLVAYAGFIFILAAAPPTSRAAATEQIVVNWHTGLAIDGYDPVAFFTDGKPMAGRPDYELRHSGVTWRFTNIGNRAAFAAQPDIYMPQYGGYDPVGVSRGLAVAGNPNVWMITGERLFLFYDYGRRDKFASDPGRVTGAADRKWADIKRTLTP